MLNWNRFDRSHKIFVWLTGIFITSLILANLVGALLFSFQLPFSYPVIDSMSPFHVKWTPEVLLSAGIIPFPVTFILTDLVNEFYGKRGARFITWLGFGMSFLIFGYLLVGTWLPVDPRLTVMPKPVFLTVASQYSGMFVASLTAYLIGQMLDIQLFHLFRAFTKHRFIWLRATGSTVVSQLFDSLIVTFVAFWGQMEVNDMLRLALGNYTWKFVIAVGITPLLYLGHGVLRGLMPRQEAMVEEMDPEYR
jgi:hypothetical protein